MALFEDNKEVKQYLALKDADGNMVAVVNPTAKGVTSEMLFDALSLKNLNVELKEVKPSLKSIKL